MMQTDVKAAYMSASNPAFNSRTRCKGVFVTPGSAAGTVVISDGGASGTVIFSTVTQLNGTPFTVNFPGEGVLCYSNLYVTLTGTGTTAVVFYG